MVQLDVTWSLMASQQTKLYLVHLGSTTSCISAFPGESLLQRRMGACDANGQPISFHVEVLQKWTEGLLFIKMSHRRIWKWVIWTIGRWKNPVTIFDHLHTCYLPEILVVRYTLWHDDHLIRFSFQTTVYKPVCVIYQMGVRFPTSLLNRTITRRSLAVWVQRIRLSWFLGQKDSAWYLFYWYFCILCRPFC